MKKDSDTKRNNIIMKLCGKVWGGNKLEILGIIMVSVQICLILVSNLTKMEMTIDGDAAKLLVHIIEMWQEKTLLIKDWSYITTMELDCTTLFALPLYGLTGHIYLSCAISNFLLLILLVASLFFLFDDKRKIYAVCCILLICTPYKVGMIDYYNMLFFAGTQYIVKVMIPIIAVGLLWSIEQNENRKNRKKIYFFEIVYFIMLFISCMSSNIYVAVCGIMPIFVVYVGYKFFSWERIPNHNFVLMGVSVVCVGVGTKLNSIIMGGTRANQMIFCNTHELLDNAHACFFGLFKLLGGFTDNAGIAVFSREGIMMLAKMFLLLLFLICGVIALARCIKKQGDLRLWMLISIFIWNYFILSISNAKPGSAYVANRYHLIGVLPLMCVAGNILVDGFLRTNLQQQRILFLCSFMGLLILNAISFEEIFVQSEQNQDLKDFVQYCAELDVEAVYICDSTSDAEICRLLDDGRQYLSVTADGFTIVYDFYNRYNHAPMMTENVLVASKVDLGETFLIQEKTLVKFDIAGDRNLYYFVENND